MIEASAELGFRPTFQGMAEFARQSRVAPFLVGPSNVRVDIALACMPFEEEVIARSHAVEAGGVSFRIPTPEDLVIMKAIARRPQDIADITTIARFYPEMNRHRVQHWLLQFGELLEDPSVWLEIEHILDSVAE